MKQMNVHAFQCVKKRIEKHISNFRKRQNERMNEKKKEEKLRKPNEKKNWVILSVQWTHNFFYIAFICYSSLVKN